MLTQIKTQLKLAERYIVLFALLTLFANCNNTHVKSNREKRDEVAIIPGKSVIAPQNGINLIPEQDPNGIYWGLKDIVSGKLIIHYKYQKIWNFKDGLATILLNDKFGLINNRGKIIVEPNYDSPPKIEIKCGTTIFENDLSIVICDTTGKIMAAENSGNTTILPCQNRISTSLGDDRYGMTNFKHDTILPFRFREMYLLPEGFCVASEFVNYDTYYGLYDLNGKQILPPVFERIDNFYCGRSIVKKNGKWGVIDSIGKELFYTDNSSIDRFSNNYAIIHVRNKNGEMAVGMIDRNGKTVIPVIYQDGDNVSDGMVSMAQNRKYGFFDVTGKIVVPFKYSKVESFRGGIAKVWVDWQHAGYINTEGKEIIPPNFDPMDQANLRRYHNKFIIGLKDSVQHVFNYTGKEVAALKYKTIVAINETENDSKKCYLVSINNVYGVLDSDLHVKIPVKYQFIEQLLYNEFAARQQGKIGFINYDGKVISDFKYDEIEPYQYENMNPYENGLVKIIIKRKKGLINSYGKIIIPVLYDEIESFSNGLAVIKRNGKYGFVNLKGKEVIPAIYDTASAYNGYVADVTLKGKTFQINRLGKRVEEVIGD